MTISAFSDELAQVRTKKKEFLILNSMPFRQLKSFLKILIGIQYEKEIQLLDKTHFAPAFSVVQRVQEWQSFKPGSPFVVTTFCFRHSTSGEQYPVFLS